MDPRSPKTRKHRGGASPPSTEMPRILREVSFAPTSLWAPPPEFSDSDKRTIKFINQRLHVAIGLLAETGFPLPLDALDQVIRLTPELHTSLPPLTKADVQRVRRSLAISFNASTQATEPHASAMPPDQAYVALHPSGSSSGSSPSSPISKDTESSINIREEKAYQALDMVSHATSLTRGRLSGQVQEHMRCLVSCFEGFALRSVGRVDDARRAFARGIGVRIPTLKQLCAQMSAETTSIVREAEGRRQDMRKLMRLYGASPSPSTSLASGTTRSTPNNPVHQSSLSHSYSNSRNPSPGPVSASVTPIDSQHQNPASPNSASRTPAIPISRPSSGSTTPKPSLSSGGLSYKTAVSNQCRFCAVALSEGKPGCGCRVSPLSPHLSRRFSFSSDKDFVCREVARSPTIANCPPFVIDGLDSGEMRARSESLHKPGPSGRVRDGGEGESGRGWSKLVAIEGESIIDYPVAEVSKRNLRRSSLVSIPFSAYQRTSSTTAQSFERSSIEIADYRRPSSASNLLKSKLKPKGLPEIPRLDECESSGSSTETSIDRAEPPSVFLPSESHVTHVTAPPRSFSTATHGSNGYRPYLKKPMGTRDSHHPQSRWSYSTVSSEVGSSLPCSPLSPYPRSSPPYSQAPFSRPGCIPRSRDSMVSDPKPTSETETEPEPDAELPPSSNLHYHPPTLSRLEQGRSSSNNNGSPSHSSDRSISRFHTPAGATSSLPRPSPSYEGPSLPPSMELDLLTEDIVKPEENAPNWSSGPKPYQHFPGGPLVPDRVVDEGAVIPAVDSFSGRVFRATSAQESHDDEGSGGGKEEDSKGYDYDWDGEGEAHGHYYEREGGLEEWERWEQWQDVLPVHNDNEGHHNITSSLSSSSSSIPYDKAPPPTQFITRTVLAASPSRIVSAWEPTPPLPPIALGSHAGTSSPSSSLYITRMDDASKAGTLQTPAETLALSSRRGTRILASGRVGPQDGGTTLDER
ncbi:hypothetical protein MKZ38_005249 [Zalerion maritima]|uniref:Uncharacterized protein n=1 Tax=Zalerion maritima TaxID=339359 RepID=A0AAD5RKZ3_9PEZI|nr:hypothetical protein MKZ38_005249 [Zalerion maritima]